MMLLQTEECESSKRAVASLKEMVSRSENDRLRLQQRVKTLSGQLATAIVSSQSVQQRKSSATGNIQSMKRSASFAVEQGRNEDRNDEKTDLVKSQADTILKLQSRIHALEMDVDERRRRTEVEVPNEITMAQHEVKQLKERVNVLEELNDQLRRGKGVFSRRDGEGLGERDAMGSVDTTARIGDKSKGLVEVLESRIRDLMVRSDGNFESASSSHSPRLFRTNTKHLKRKKCKRKERYLQSNLPRNKRI